MSSDRFLRILLPLLLVPSCSIKENRTACPCGLTVELAGLPVRPVVLRVTGEEYALTEVVHADTVLVLSVPRGEIAVSAVGGALAEGDGSVRIPEGEEAPPLYLFHADVSTDAEQVVLPVTLHKQYCSLEMLFKGPSGYGPPFEVAVQGFYGGWEPDGSPAPGPFSRRLLPGADGRAVLRLPRQGIVFSDQVVRTFALGSYIAAAGYDWSATDLEDLSLQVDISLTSVTISTDLWSRTEDIELWI